MKIFKTMIAALAVAMLCVSCKTTTKSAEAEDVVVDSTEVVTSVDSTVIAE